jgi:glycosyltransferase involved in cell wall biosynthesis
VPVTEARGIRSRSRAVAARLAGRAVPSRPPTGRPKLSIVVPVYNVEAYLAACLDSILAQPIDDYEVVLVDDGATDSSASIAQQYVDRHPHLRMVRQANAGLGAARNAGVAASRGELLAFVDSDDELPPDAYSVMLATLERSGSDFVVGMLKRDDGQRQFATPRMRENHRAERIGADIHAMPRMLADVFAVNKMFRRSFWDTADLSFPVGVRYEDQPTLTRAFLAARSFDVVRETVYLWRIREDGSSITQRRSDLADLIDRVVTKRDSNALVLQHAPDARKVWLADILPVDMGEYFRSVPDCSDDYWTTLREAVREFWTPDTVPFEDTLVPVQQRLMGWLVTRDRRADLEKLVGFVDDHRDGGLPVEVRGDHVVCLLPGVDDPASGIPQHLFRLGEHELRWEARAVSVDWAEDALVVHGFALVRNVPTAGRDTILSLQLTGPGGATAEVGLEARAEPRATRFVGRTGDAFDACGFTATVDPATLLRGDGSAQWRFSFERRVEQVVGGGGITSWNPPVVARAWHEGPGWTARLRDVDGELVVDVRRT